MKTQTAIEKAGSIKQLAELLGISRPAISQWGEDVPFMRVFQLKAIKPDWFTENQSNELQNKND